MNLIDFIIHIDAHLLSMLQNYGTLIYVIMFLIIFTETGVIIMPFLPGDSLLFALGALIAMDGSGLNVYYMAALLVTAAFLGDNMNYYIGRKIGPKVFRFEKSLFFNPKYLKSTHVFYEKHGTKAVILARFVPILRTFAPFVAGVGEMKFSTFRLYNIVGAVLWVNLFLFAGFYFGNLTVVRKNFQMVIMGVILVSVLPIVIEFIRGFRQRQKVS